MLSRGALAGLGIGLASHVPGVLVGWCVYVTNVIAPRDRVTQALALGWTLDVLVLAPIILLVYFWRDPARTKKWAATGWSLGAAAVFVVSVLVLKHTANWQVGI